MKKILKALGIAALAAAVVPCKVEKDEETGKKTYQSLLSKLQVGPGEDGEGTDIRLSLLGGVIPSALGKSEEEEDYIDDDFEDMVTEPIFEMKLERHVPATEDGAKDAAEEERAAADTMEAEAKAEEQAASDAMEAEAKAEEQAAGAEMSRELSETSEV